MDVRTSTSPIVRRASVGLELFNTRHPWSHNDHFHPWILRRLPVQRRRALDVGCGRGLLLERLRPNFEAVDGVDVDADMCAAARNRLRGNVSVSHQPFSAVSGKYDLVTMVAVLHHLDIDIALTHVREILAPGGKFLAVGLAKPDTLVDLLWDIASAVANPVVGVVKHPRPSTQGRQPSPFPVRDPTMTFDEISAVAARSLPGARCRRRLYFRYTLEWTK